MSSTTLNSPEWVETIRLRKERAARQAEFDQLMLLPMASRWVILASRLQHVKNIMEQSKKEETNA